jgi:dihydrodipicolinate synthase/N-acetylneuraminate lyase
LRFAIHFCLRHVRPVATVATLFERGLTIGIKDATAALGRPPRLRALCAPAFMRLSGDDATAAAYRAAGGHGCVLAVNSPGCGCELPGIDSTTYSSASPAIAIA